MFLLPSNTSIESLRAWMKAAPIAVPLRVLVPVFRTITGHPIKRFSRVHPYLWVGGQQYRRGVETLYRQGIRAVLNMRKHPDDREFDRIPNEVDYLWLPTTDHHPPEVPAILQGINFIQDHIDNGEDVYVHCRAGVGRGPTMAAYYLVSTGMTPTEAWATIRKSRPFIFPTVLQIQSVQNLYDTVFAPQQASTQNADSPTKTTASA